MSKPILYEQNATNFENLGLGVLSEAKSCLVVEERNGVFELTMEYPMNGALFSFIKNDNIIKVDTGHDLKEQRFRIKRVLKTGTGIVSVYAQHVSYITKDLPLGHNLNFSGTAQDALQQWSDRILDNHPLTVESDITTVNSTSLHIGDVSNARKALGGVRGSFLDTWGGEYLFDNYHIKLLRNRGVEANTIISYGRNLISLAQEENIANTFTSIFPYAIHRDGEREQIIVIPEHFIDSQHVNNFPNRRVQKVDFSSDFGQDEIPTVQRLRELTRSFISNNDVGVPRVSIRISFIDLTKALNAGGVPFERINLCDTVPVFFERLGISTRAKVVRTVWNVLLEQYDSLDIGDMRPSLSAHISSIGREVREAVSDASLALQAIGGWNTIFHRISEPVPNGVGDLWFRPDGEDIDLLRWNGSRWALLISTRLDERIVSKINGVSGEVTLLKESIASTGEQITLLEEKIEALDEKVDGIEEKVDDLNNKTESQGEEIGEMNERIDELERIVGELINDARR